jgi:hypothetical protein
MTRGKDLLSFSCLGYGVDGLGQFGNFERILPILEARQKLFIETFGAAPPLPEPSAEGRSGIIPPLVAAHARVILPDLRGFGASAKSREVSFYSDWAMARDVIALIEHLHLDAVDVVAYVCLPMFIALAGRHLLRQLHLEVEERIVGSRGLCVLPE